MSAIDKPVRDPSESSVVQPDEADVHPPGSSGTGGRVEPSRPSGDRQGSFALLLLIGVPLALIVLVLWQFVMQTSAEFNLPERVVGWSAVLRESPATLLVFVPVVAGLVLGVQSARLGSRRGVVAIWLHSLIAFLVAVLVFSGELITPVEWILPAAGAIAVLLLCFGAVRMRPLDLRAASVPGRSPLAGRFRLAALLPVVGIGVAFLWLLVAQAVLTSHANGFVRASIPEIGVVRVVTVPVDRTGAYYVYVEGGDVGTLRDLAVQVTDPTGRVIPVQAVTPRALYLHDWRGGSVVGTFDASRAGDYQVASNGTLPPVDAPYAPSNPYGNFAVGDSVANWMRPHELGVAALLFVTVGSGVVLAVVTVVQGRRNQAG